MQMQNTIIVAAVGQSMFNPFKYWREERAKDREAMLHALDTILDAQRRQAEVAIEQSRALRGFIDSFLNFTNAPVRRVSTDETEAEAEQLTWGEYGES